jgi:hypothetical protein
MKETVLFMSKFLRLDNAFLFLVTATLLVLIIAFGLAYYKVSSSPSTVALHYNVIIGVDVLGGKFKLYQVPLTAVIIAVVNMVLIKFLPVSQKYLRLVLMGTSLACSVIALLSILFLFQVN